MQEVDVNKPFGRPRGVFKQLADIQRLTDEMLDRARNVMDYYAPDATFPRQLEQGLRDARQEMEGQPPGVVQRLRLAELKFNVVLSVLNDMRFIMAGFEEAAGPLQRPELIYRL
jgi:hypothetical protein